MTDEANVARADASLPYTLAMLGFGGGAVLGTWDPGARIVAPLLHELRRRGGRHGLATLCLGGGGSVAMAFERV